LGAGQNETAATDGVADDGDDLALSIQDWTAAVSGVEGSVEIQLEGRDLGIVPSKHAANE